jgi:hypothetical protein
MHYILDRMSNMCKNITGGLDGQDKNASQDVAAVVFGVVLTTGYT